MTTVSILLAFTFRTETLVENPGRAAYPPVAPFTQAAFRTAKPYIPMIFPVVGRHQWRRTFMNDFGSHRHTGEDIVAPKMTPIVAPFAGKIWTKPNSFWIVTEKGVRCLGTHLNNDTPGTRDNRAQRDFMFAPDIRNGDTVWPGRLIGWVGDSGWATGPHLHFELYDGPRLVDPGLSLKMAQRISAPRRRPGTHERALPGEIRLDGVRRGFDEKTNTLTLLLTAVRHGGAPVRVQTRPRWVEIRLTPEAVETMGGEDAIREWPSDRTLSVWTRPSGSGFGYARKLVATLDPEPLVATRARR